ncbi:membrane integrity-associated transporter subunit PqiC [Acetobacter sacchari]|uniref:Membrane integrity-associated transporter subunit PqiC n=1 Tax=Acetobacter sacchari TaxID=2661687 RepID=A0ABS3LV90_9PROT|nr:PqiC family protein [Acetobacter sacchari]MBO1359835.1 membrane integrity-associated transporter subunit PqiC [Acetobacter sacchari]
MTASPPRPALAPLRKHFFKKYVFFGNMLCAAALCATLEGCASAALRLYTLDAPAIPSGTSANASAAVVEISRIRLPDYLDTQNIVTRDGQFVRTSPNGRWAERLSNGLTDLLAAKIRQARPDLIVTETPLTGAPTSRLMLDITRFDVSASGVATLDAHWAIVGAQGDASASTGQTSLTASGPVSSDADVVSLMNRLSAQAFDKVIQNLATIR